LRIRESCPVSLARETVGEFWKEIPLIWIGNPKLILFFALSLILIPIRRHLLLSYGTKKKYSFENVFGEKKQLIQK